MGKNKKVIIVYRQRSSDGIFEVGETSSLIKEINRTAMIKGWCDSRICETWSEQSALRLVSALQLAEDKK